MAFFSSIKSWLAARGIQRRFRFPALAAANRVLLLLENEITDFSAISAVMEAYKRAQDIGEPFRDSAYIPIYFDLEAFLASHQPPTTKGILTVPQIRDKVRANINIKELNEPFRLVFLPDNQQTDRLLKMGATEMLHFLLTSLGQAQLTALIQKAVGQTPLEAIKATDDGISFEEVHPRMELFSAAEVLAAYRKLYQALYTEVRSLFGDAPVQELIVKAKAKIAAYYPNDMVSIFLNALPPEARP